MSEKYKKGSIAETVQKEISKSKSALEYLRGLAKGVLSHKVKAMIGAAIYTGPEITEKKVKTVQEALAAFDIKSARQATNYIKAGRVAIKAQMTEAQVIQVGIARLCDFANKLLNEEATDNFTTVQTHIKTWEGERAKKREQKQNEADAQKAKRKEAAKNSMELLNEEFEDEDELSESRVWAHLTVHFADIDAQIKAVLGDNSSTGLKNLRKLIVNAAEAKAKKETKKGSRKAS